MLLLLLCGSRTSSILSFYVFPLLLHGGGKFVMNAMSKSKRNKSTNRGANVEIWHRTKMRHFDRYIVLGRKLITNRSIQLYTIHSFTKCALETQARIL